MEEKSKDKEGAKIGKSQAVMLGTFFLVMLFVSAFSCYSCSYESPLTPLDEEEARFVLTRLVATSWALDTTEGEATLPELYNLVITDLVFDEELSEDGTLRVSLKVKDKVPVPATILQSEDGNITLSLNKADTVVLLSWSSSKDGKTETITLRGGESKAQCYYLKQ